MQTYLLSFPERPENFPGHFITVLFFTTSRNRYYIALFSLSLTIQKYFVSFHRVRDLSSSLPLSSRNFFGLIII